MANKSKPKFPGKLNVNQSDNTRVLNTEGRTVANSKLQDEYNKNEIIQYGTNKGKPYGFENQTIRGGMESLVTPDNVMMAMGVGALAKAGVNAVGNKFLPNLGKKIGIPQIKFENPNSFYRQIDKETFKEGKNLGVIKGKQNVNKTSGESVINLNKSFGEDAYYKKGSLYSPQKADYIYEVQKGEEAFIPKLNNKTKGLTVENTPIRVSKTPIPLDEAKIYKKDWLKGYKELPKQFKSLEKNLTKEEMVNLYRIQEKGGKTFAQNAAEGRVHPLLNKPEALAKKANEEKYFGQWFTKDKNDLKFYSADREFVNPEMINLKVPASKLSQFQNYDKMLSRAPEREFVIPHDMQQLYKHADGGTTEDEAGNRGMMKARMALDAHFGNPSAQRMVSPNPKTGMTPEGIGTHYMASMDNYAVPLLQDKGGNYLQYNSNPAPSSEDMRFESPEDAKYFAENYKNIAPMMRSNNFAGGGRVLPKFGNNRIVKYPTGGDVFSNPELANALPDNSPVRIGNEDLYKNYKPQASEYIYEKEIPVVAPINKMPAVVSKTVAPSKVIKKAIKKEEATIENMSPVKKAMITNPAKAQTFQPLAADAQAVYEEKKKNPAWKNFKGNYSIYSKENSMLHLFDNKHNLLDQTRAGRGVGKGDAPNLANPKDWYDSSKPKKGQERAIKNATTPAGAYAIKENPMNYNDYGTKTYKFGKPNQYNAQAAMHGIYKGDTYNRTKIINDPNIKQAYVSNGCLNIPAPFLNKNDAQINSGDSLFVTKEPKFATGGKVLPRFGDAGTVDTGAGITDYAGYAQMAMPIAHMLMPDEQVKDTRGNVVGNKMDTGYAVGSKALEWGAKGAQFGGPAGAIVGATIGAGLGYFDNKKNNTKIAKQKLLNDDSYYNEDTSKAFNTNTGNFTTRPSTNTNIRFAAGGQVIDEDMGNPNAELELNETFRDPMTGETGMVDGPSHDDGGIEMSLAEGTQIWSDRLKHNGRTFASLTKPIINKIANIEKGLDTNPNSRFKQNSIKLLNAQLDFFFDIQESNKQQDEMKRTLKKQEGGVVDDMGNYHYANGGIYIKPENRNKMAMGGMMKYDEGGTKNQYLLPDGSYNKRQFMLDQLNPNKNQYKAFDPAMSIYKANQNADLAKEKNSLGAEMDQMNIASRGNTPITMGPMNRPEGYIDYTNVNIPETIQGRQLPAFADASRPPVNNAPVYSGANDPFRKISNQYDPNIVNASKVNTTPAYQPYNSGATKPGGMINFNRELPKPVLPQVYNSTPYIKARGNQNPYKGTDIAGTKTVDNNGNITDSNLTNNTPISKMDEFRNRIESYRNRGKIGQGVTAAISNQTQADRLKGLARPDKINNVNYLSSLTGPDLVNYGNQRNAIEQGASAVTDKAGRYLGNSGSIMATANAANLQKQQQLAESYQGQENTNAGIMNQALAQKNQLNVAQAERNSAIEQENKANKYAYDAMIAAGLNSNDAITASQMGKMFGNDVSFGNDLERSRILGNKYAGKVWNSTDDNTIAANNSQLGYGRFGGVVGKLNKPMIKKGMPGKRSLKNK